MPSWNVSLHELYLNVSKIDDPKNALHIKIFKDTAQDVAATSVSTQDLIENTFIKFFTFPQPELQVSQRYLAIFHLN